MNFGTLQWENLRDLLISNDDLMVKVAGELVQSRIPRGVDNHRDADRTQAMLREIRGSLAVIQDVVWLLSGEPTEAQRDEIQAEASREEDLPF